MQLRQNAKLSIALNQKMQKFFSILQMSGLELQQTITQALEENPFLEEKNETIPYYPMPDLPYQKSPLALLKNQIQESFNHSLELKNAEILLHDLDERGFFSSPFNALQEKLKIDAKELQALIEKLQELTPAGIFCFDLQTSFLNQAKKQKWPKVFLSILENDFALFEKGNFKLLQKKYSQQILLECKKRFSRLNFQPLQSLQIFSPIFSFPDFIIKKENNLWTIVLNDDFLPKISFNNSYEKIKFANEDEKKQTLLWKAEAKEFLLFLNKRKHLLYDILNIIIPLQSDFLENAGPLKNCSLDMIAKKLNLHQTTIWRAIQDKRVFYPAGEILLKDLISSNSKSKDAKQILLFLLTKENKMQVLTDSAIVLELKKRGFSFARRTIAKYRKQLSLPSSRKR